MGLDFEGDELKGVKERCSQIRVSLFIQELFFVMCDLFFWEGFWEMVVLRCQDDFWNYGENYSLYLVKLKCQNCCYRWQKK